ncbi:MAG: adenylosuccinate synthase [Anaerolineae bacterium]|nr:adenylosuccinate synthase [Anaerolineae bacterium]
MALDILIGVQWGDEGKGRFVDLLSQQMDYVARFAGGDNAGHTIHIGERVFKLHLLPSGMIDPRPISVLGAGMVINPVVLLKEMEFLRESGIPVNPSRLLISHRAHLVTPGHRLLDQLNEARRGAQKIGTTGRGIGPAYVDKVNRSGILFNDLLIPDRLIDKLTMHMEEVNQRVRDVVGFETIPVDQVIDDYTAMAEILRPYIADVGEVLRQALSRGKRILAEGAQGALLDIDHGGYPFVTSSSCLAPNALLSLGVGMPKDVRVIGVFKAFQTRVGEGDFPTEVFDETTAILRGDGSKPWDEFGTTTGRPRRVGWLDGVLLRQMAALNGVSVLGLTKLDVLSGLPVVKMCTAYGGQKVLDPLLVQGQVEPTYQDFPGWEGDLQSVRKWLDLPSNARHYVEAIEAFMDIPIRWVSVGPERQQVIYRDEDDR